MALPALAAIAWVAVGLAVFGAIGGIYGQFEEPIKEELAAQIKQHPAQLEGQGEEAEEVAIPTGGSLDEQASAVAEEAWTRLKFFHGHGLSMVLASFVALTLIANAKMGDRLRAWLTWVGLASMTLYNVGWFFAGILVPWKGLEGAKEFGEFLFFVPFGVITVVVWVIVLVVWAKEALNPETA
jgi:hypothetical protein